jgi:hypothetical protein
LENKLEKPPVCVCACGCAADVAPMGGKSDVAAGFALRELPKRLPPNPPVLAGCEVPGAAFDAPPPMPPNKPPGVVPVPVLGSAPKSDLAAGVLLEAGCAPPRLPKSDMVVDVLLRRVGCAENNDRVHETMEELGPC